MEMIADAGRLAACFAGETVMGTEEEPHARRRGL